ncbi:MAG: glycosyltransferase family 2 protein [Firmicutes bacterium]|nr:glycosyltransferase family 2 protein [Bacillota bacterium]
MPYQASDHTFAICAYGDSPFLESCIASLRAQTEKSHILLCTATPSPFLEEIAKKYALPLLVNPEKPGIASDWNFAYASVQTPLVTLAHQDDIYEPEFLAATLAGLNAGGEALIAFTEYYEIHGDKKLYAKDFLNLRIKKWMLAPLKITAFQPWVWLRRRMLSVCDPIGCPSVTYVKPNLPETVFHAKFTCDIDWQTWEALSRRKGRFVYVGKPLLGHRMHADCTTVKTIQASDVRSQEDYEMFCAFWPKPIARGLSKLYSRSQQARKKQTS